MAKRRQGLKRWRRATRERMARDWPEMYGKRYDRHWMRNHRLRMAAFNGSNLKLGQLCQYGCYRGEWFIATQYDLRKGTGIYRVILPCPSDVEDAKLLARKHLAGMRLTSQQRRELCRWFAHAAHKDDLYD